MGGGEGIAYARVLGRGIRSVLVLDIDSVAVFRGGHVNLDARDEMEEWGMGSSLRTTLPLCVFTTARDGQLTQTSISQAFLKHRNTAWHGSIAFAPTACPSIDSPGVSETPESCTTWGLARSLESICIPDDREIRLLEMVMPTAMIPRKRNVKSVGSQYNHRKHAIGWRCTRNMELNMVELSPWADKTHPVEVPYSDGKYPWL
jgi:hypothetical protein